MDTAVNDVIRSPKEYMAGFRAAQNLTDSHVQMLRIPYHAPARTVTATRLAVAAGYKSYRVANSQYGRLGRIIGEQINSRPEEQWVSVLVTFEIRQGEWHWIMRPQVAEALESLGWVDDANVLLPEEIAATTSLVEGAVFRVIVNAYERNPEARRRCIERHGTNCCVCGFNFGGVYGEVAEGYIHVHHLRPLSEIGREYVIDPIEDLRPVCPNCHAVLHRRIPAFSIEEIRAILRRQVGTP